MLLFVVVVEAEGSEFICIQTNKKLFWFWVVFWNSFSNQLPCALHFCSYLEEEQLSQMPQRGAWKHDEALWWAFLRERFYRLRAADFKAQQVPLLASLFDQEGFSDLFHLYYTLTRLKGRGIYIIKYYNISFCFPSNPGFFKSF